MENQPEISLPLTGEQYSEYEYIKYYSNTINPNLLIYHALHLSTCPVNAFILH